MSSLHSYTTRVSHKRHLYFVHLLRNNTALSNTIKTTQTSIPLTTTQFYYCNLPPCTHAKLYTTTRHIHGRAWYTTAYPVERFFVPIPIYMIKINKTTIYAVLLFMLCIVLAVLTYADTAPRWSGASTTSVTEGEYLVFILADKVTGNPQFALYHTQETAWLSVVQGVLSGLAPQVSADKQYTITIRASNSAGSGERTFTITVKDSGVTTSGRATTSPFACSNEVRVCPGGQTVGRTGQNCEFAPCPQPLPVNAQGVPILGDDCQAARSQCNTCRRLGSGVQCTEVYCANEQFYCTLKTPQQSNQGTTSIAIERYARHLLVLKTQQLLNKTTCKITTSGPGSPGNETDYFGNKTHEALVCDKVARNTTYNGTITQALTDNLQAYVGTLPVCTPIHGGWSTFLPSSLTACGTTQTATCTNPAPSCGGRYCSGTAPRVVGTRCASGKSCSGGRCVQSTTPPAPQPPAFSQPSYPPAQSPSAATPSCASPASPPPQKPSASIVVNKIRPTPFPLIREVKATFYISPSDGSFKYQHKLSTRNDCSTTVEVRVPGSGNYIYDWDDNIKFQSGCSRRKGGRCVGVYWTGDDFRGRKTYRTNSTLDDYKTYYVCLRRADTQCGSNWSEPISVMVDVPQECRGGRCQCWSYNPATGYSTPGDPRSLLGECNPYQRCRFESRYLDRHPDECQMILYNDCLEDVIKHDTDPRVYNPPYSYDEARLRAEDSCAYAKPGVPAYEIPHGPAACGDTLFSCDGNSSANCYSDVSKSIEGVVTQSKLYRNGRLDSGKVGHCSIQDLVPGKTYHWMCIDNVIGGGVAVCSKEYDWEVDSPGIIPAEVWCPAKGKVRQCHEGHVYEYQYEWVRGAASDVYDTGNCLPSETSKVKIEDCGSHGCYNFSHSSNGRSGAWCHACSEHSDCSDGKLCLRNWERRAGGASENICRSATGRGTCHSSEPFCHTNFGVCVQCFRIQTPPHLYQPRDTLLNFK